MRKKIFKPKLIIIFLFLIIFSNSQVEASSWELVCRQSDQDCEFVNSAEEKFFKEDNLTPGQIIKRQFSVSNETNKNCFLELEAIPTSEDQNFDLAQVINTYIFSNNKTWFGQSLDNANSKQLTLADLFNTGLIKLGKISPGEKEIYYWLAIIDKWRTNNSWQGTNTIFDISFHVQCLDKESVVSSDKVIKNDIPLQGQVKGVSVEKNKWQQVWPPLLIGVDAMVILGWLIWI